MSSNQKYDRDHPGTSQRKEEKARKMQGRRGIDQQRRMTSITRKLHWYWIRRRLWRFIVTDAVIFILAAAGWCADREYARCAEIVWKNQRSLFVSETTGNLIYKVVSPEGKLLLYTSVKQPLLILCAVLAGLFAVQILSLFFSYFREDRKIRRILDPINAIALKADELSRMSFSEDKYQRIEEALASIDPEQSGDSAPLHFGDSDLGGVEAAMNNLLLRMRETYRQQSRFVNDASHELRTPIAVIQGYASMLDRWGKTDPHILEEGITAIKNEADHMNHLVEQLLFLARGDSGKTTLNMEKFSACSMMQEIYEESFMIDEDHIYRLSLPEKEITLNADQGLLKQAVRILIDNAAKYTLKGEEILLSAGMNESGIPYLQVQDLGIGMAESEIPHIFERFLRSDEVRSSTGTGLGLSIAKWIVDKHGGHFEILSRQGLGTRIRILLPQSTVS